MFTLESLYKVLVENSTDLISFHDIRGIYLFASPYSETLLGYKPEELVGLNPYSLFHPDDIENVRTSHNTIMTDGASYSIEYRHRCKNGQYRWVETVSKTICLEGDDSIYIIATTRLIEERKQLEQRLVESEGYLKKSQEVARLGHYVLDVESGTWSSSEALDNIFGIDQDFNRTVENWLKLIRPDYRETMQQYFMEDVLGRHSDFDRIYPVVNQTDGSIRWVQGLGALRTDQEGRILQMFGTIQDITAQYYAEREQRLLKNRLNALWKVSQLIDAGIKEVCDCILTEIVDLTNSPYGFYGFMDEREEVMAIHSWSKDAMSDCTIHNQPLEFPIEKAGIWGNAVRNRRPFILNDYQKECENKKGLPQGHVNLTRVMSVPVIVGGKIVALGAVANKEQDYQEEDVAELLTFLNSAQILVDRNRLQSSLQDSEGFYRLLFDEAMHGTAIADLETGQILSCNRKLADLVGRSIDELVGQHQSFLHLPPGEPRGETESYTKHKMACEGEVIEDQLFHKEGYFVDVEIVANRLTVAGREVLHGVIYDISERKKVMEEYRRSAQLAALGTVAAGVAHEINNPIQGILNYATILKNKPDQIDRTVDISGRIIRESERISEITRELLAFARDDHNKMETTDICPLVESAIDLIEKKIIRQGISIETNCPIGLPNVLLYPQGIQQIVINLIDNASDALENKDMPTSEKVIKVSCYVVEKGDGQKMCLEVADRGIGMTEEVLEKAGETFFSTKPSSKGTGLGLSIVTDIINRHNGSMEIESAAGKYTKVKLYIPIAGKVS